MAGSTRSESGREGPVPADDLSLARCGATGCSVSVPAGRETTKLPLSQISQSMTVVTHPLQSLPDRIPTGSFG
jgi:hypothetical protein